MNGRKMEERKKGRKGGKGSRLENKKQRMKESK
jgi:hypothetical protein